MSFSASLPFFSSAQRIWNEISEQPKIWIMTMRCIFWLNILILQLWNTDTYIEIQKSQNNFDKNRTDCASYSTYVMNVWINWFWRAKMIAQKSSKYQNELSESMIHQAFKSRSYALPYDMNCSAFSHAINQSLNRLILLSNLLVLKINQKKTTTTSQQLHLSWNYLSKTVNHLLHETKLITWHVIDCWSSSCAEQ